MTFAYDNLGNLHTTSYGDGTATRTYGYNKNGDVTSISGGGYSQSYGYNAMRLLDHEALSIDGKTFKLAYEYSGLGHLSALTYPNETLPVKFAPNGFGQATQAIKYDGSTVVQTFVKGDTNKATYWPSGYVKSFTYGNGFKHKTSLNTRLLPSCIQDYKGSSVPSCNTAVADNAIQNVAVTLKYGYYKNNNITSIHNRREAAYSLSNLGYDKLNRLVSTTGGASIGSSAISYDGLGNIRSYTNTNAANGHSFTEYKYTSNNRLEAIVGSTGYDFYEV